MSRGKLRLFMSGLVLLHLIVVSLHGVAHQHMHIGLERWQRVFVGSVIVGGPLVALGVLWIARAAVGTLLLAISMAGSSAFGVCYHFFISSPDNIFLVQQSGWGFWFSVTAVLLAIIETIGFIWCVLVFRQRTDVASLKQSAGV